MVRCMDSNHSYEFPYGFFQPDFLYRSICTPDLPGSVPNQGRKIKNCFIEKSQNRYYLFLSFSFSVSAIQLLFQQENLSCIAFCFLILSHYKCFFQQNNVIVFLYTTTIHTSAVVCNITVTVHCNVQKSLSYWSLQICILLCADTDSLHSQTLPVIDILFFSNSDSLLLIRCIEIQLFFYI